jgi:hypothetical protein
MLKSFNYTVRDEKKNLKMCNLKRINLSNNDLIKLYINCDDIQYLNVENNKNFSNIVDFDIKIDTIIRKNIKNDLPLKRLLVAPPKNISGH